MKYAKFLVIILAFLQPLIIIAFNGFNPPSFSEIIGTKLEPLFIIVNASSSFFLFSLRNWKIQSIALMLLTAFSTYQFEILHYILAVIFFISTFIALLKSKIYAYLYVLLSIIGGLISLFYFEFIAVYIINIYHLNNLIKYYKKL